MSSRIDLHTHTTASDGTLTPADLLQKADALAVRVLAMADHDTTVGYQSALELLPKFPDIKLIPAIEINAEGALACHVLGYWLDVAHPDLQRALADYREQRIARARKMVEKLQQLKVRIEFDQVVTQAKGGSIGRPHIADVLIANGVVGSRQAAFDRFLKKDGPGYVPGEAPSAAEAIALIRRAGGVPVLAHPCYYTSEEFLQKLVDAGLMGLEVYYPEHSKSLTSRYLEMAQRYGLVVTGGSDFHGPATGRTRLACVDVPEEVLAGLDTARQRI